VPFILSGYGATYAAKTHQVREVTVPFGRSLRVVHLSDIHAGLYMTREEMKDYAALAAILERPACTAAKAMIVCVVDPRPILGEHSFAMEDCAASVENMLLAITALGYAGVWIGGVLRDDNVARLKKRLKLGSEDVVEGGVVGPGGEKGNVVDKGDCADAAEVVSLVRLQPVGGSVAGGGGTAAVAQHVHRLLFNPRSQQLLGHSGHMGDGQELDGLRDLLEVALE
jgi:hypothetical protein